METGKLFLFVKSFHLNIFLQTFTEWRSEVKRKAREIYISQNETGGGLGTEKFLTSLEMQLISVLGLICIEGISVPELGLGSSEDMLQNSRKFIEPIAKLTLKDMKSNDTHIRTKFIYFFSLYQNCRAQNYLTRGTVYK